MMDAEVGQFISLRARPICEAMGATRELSPLETFIQIVLLNNYLILTSIKC